MFMLINPVTENRYFGFGKPVIRENRFIRAAVELNNYGTPAIKRAAGN